MTVPRIDPQSEAAFRDALDLAAKAKMSELDRHLDGFSDELGDLCLGLCALVTGYVAIQICGHQWPDTDNRHRIARAVAETGELVKQTGLTEQDAYDYVARVALGFERLDKVVVNPSKCRVFPFVVASSMLATFGKRGMTMWEYLDQIEGALEAAWAVDLNLLPALILRNAMPRADTN